MDNTFSEAELIGNVLSKYQFGIGDLQIALRIEKMTENGELFPVTAGQNGDLIYRRKLQQPKITKVDI